MSLYLQPFSGVLRQAWLDAHPAQVPKFRPFICPSCVKLVSFQKKCKCGAAVERTAAVCQGCGQVGVLVRPEAGEVWGFEADPTGHLASSGKIIFSMPFPKFLCPLCYAVTTAPPKHRCSSCHFPLGKTTWLPESFSLWDWGDEGQICKRCKGQKISVGTMGVQTPERRNRFIQRFTEEG